jgi:hypothetical protein
MLRLVTQITANFLGKITNISKTNFTLPRLINHLESSGGGPARPSQPSHVPGIWPAVAQQESAANQTRCANRTQALASRPHRVTPSLPPTPPHGQPFLPAPARCALDSTRVGTRQGALPPLPAPARGALLASARAGKAHPRLSPRRPGASRASAHHLGRNVFLTPFSLLP